MSSLLGGVLSAAARAWAALGACGDPGGPVVPPEPPIPPDKPVKFRCLVEWRCRYNCDDGLITGPVATCIINPLDPSHPTNPGIGSARWAGLPRNKWQWCNPSISGCGTGNRHWDCNSGRPGWDMTFSIFIETEEEISFEEYNSTPLANPTCPWPPDPASAPQAITKDEVVEMGGKCPTCYKAYPCVNNVPGACGSPQRTVISSCCRSPRHPDIFPPRTPYIDTKTCGGTAGNPLVAASTCEYRFCTFNDYSDPKYAFVRKCQGVPGSVANSVNYGCGGYIAGKSVATTPPMYGASCGWWECLRLELYQKLPEEKLAIIEPFGGSPSFFDSAHPTCDDCAFDGPIITYQRCSSNYINPDGNCSTVANAVLNNKIFFRRWGSIGGRTREWMDTNVDSNNKIYFCSSDGLCWVMEYLPNPTCTQMNMTMWGATAASPGRAVFRGHPIYISTLGSQYILAGKKLGLKSCCDCGDKTFCSSGIPNSICNPVVGACCIVDEGICLDVKTQAQCAGLKNAKGPTQWYKAKVCGDITCNPGVGACCKGGGDCLDNTTKVNCLNNFGGTAWYKSRNCASLSGAECEKKGVCCNMSKKDWRARCSLKTKGQCLSLPNRVWKGTGKSCTPTLANPSPDICKTPREKQCGILGDNSKCTVITITTYQNNCNGAKPVSSKWFTSSGASWGFVGVGGRVDRSFIGKWICAEATGRTGVPGKITNIQYPVLYKDIPVSYCKNEIRSGTGGNNRKARDGSGNYKTYKYCAYKGAFGTDNKYVDSCSARPVPGRETEGGGNCGGRCGGRQSWEGCCNCPKSSGGTD
jgi:hypothetical protein